MFARVAGGAEAGGVDPADGGEELETKEAQNSSGRNGTVICHMPT